jgi:serine/threonine-protein kinase
MRVAIKLYSQHVLAERSESIRIQREFYVASQIEHPNIVRVHDVVLSPSRRYAFLVMDLVEGDTLKARIPRRGMTSAEVVSIGTQIFAALHEIHARRALHRDVKAANIMVTSPRNERPILKLLDFGIVSIASDPSMTGTSVFLGSKHSSPLEQLMGRELDDRTDIYAAGATLYHCYTGEPMYSKDGPEGAIVARMLSGPLMLRGRGESPIDVRLVDFVNRCTSIDPSDRPSTASLCRDELISLDVASHS